MSLEQEQESVGQRPAISSSSAAPLEKHGFVGLLGGMFYEQPADLVQKKGDRSGSINALFAMCGKHIRKWKWTTYFLAAVSKIILISLVLYLVCSVRKKDLE